MDFELTDEQKMICTNARNFIAKEIAPVADEYDRRGALTKEEAVGFIKQLIPFGYYNGTMSEEYGGMGLDYLTDGMLIEELSYAWAGLAGMIWLATPLGFTDAPDEIKKKYLPLLRTGEVIGCGGITEPNVGSDSANMETNAVLDGDEWVINGSKIWISNGQISDVCVVLCVTDKSKGPLGISQIMVDREASPYGVRGLHKLGLRAWPTAEISFVDCRVPRDNILGDPSLGYKHIMLYFESARARLAAMSTGISQAAIDASIAYARERTQFGKPIGSFQMIQEMIADMIAATEAMRLLTYRSFYLTDRGERARWQSSLAKAYATEMAIDVTSKAIQIHGAMGLSDEYPVERYFRDARTMTIPDGTTQIQKLVMGRELIGIRAFA
ncbi:MAG: acyl-CoA dehydrogenase family protein [Chloroflexota bacterium]|nr:acyl-CoA dehydrogenase family protein [Chloroflexota bacterium]